MTLLCLISLQKVRIFCLFQLNPIECPVAVYGPEIPYIVYDFDKNLRAHNICKLVSENKNNGMINY